MYVPLSFDSPFAVRRTRPGLNKHCKGKSKQHRGKFNSARVNLDSARVNLNSARVTLTTQELAYHRDHTAHNIGFCIAVGNDITVSC